MVRNTSQSPESHSLYCGARPSWPSFCCSRLALKGEDSEIQALGETEEPIIDKIKSVWGVGGGVGMCVCLCINTISSRLGLQRQ